MKTLMKPSVVALILLCLSSLFSCGISSTRQVVSTPSSSEAQEAFTRLKSLVGSWEKSGSKDSQFRVVFSLTANETVLVETWMRGGEAHSSTLYHPDGDALLATHYCPQGNQPRLRFNGSSAENMISFKFQDVTNLLDPTQSRQTSLSFEIGESSQSMIRREVYSGSEPGDESSLSLVRSKG